MTDFEKRLGAAQKSIASLSGALATAMVLRRVGSRAAMVEMIDKGIKEMESLKSLLLRYGRDE